MRQQNRMIIDSDSDENGHISLPKSLVMDIKRLRSERQRLVAERTLAGPVALVLGILGVILAVALALTL